MKFLFFDTLTKSYVDFNPSKEGIASIYTCGPTVYSNAHIGNFRAFLLGDLLTRSLKAIAGLEVRWVVNITDIDDKIIARSSDVEYRTNEMGPLFADPKQNLITFARYYENLFFQDLKKIGIDPTSIFSSPRATEYIPQMVSLIQILVKKGYAYLSEGSVYFDVEKWRSTNKYGRLKRLDSDNMEEIAVATQDRLTEKKSPFDFVLWKAAKENEPAWEFIYDDNTLMGRPGWHLECSAMGKDTLGLPIDIHTGGIDLCFPHHEDELAQSKAAFETEPVNLWMHNEFLDLDGEKMSKSTGNIWNLSDLEQNGISPDVYRYSILTQHYRKKISFSLDSCMAASKGMHKIQEYIYDLYSRKEYCDSEYCSDLKKVWVADNNDAPNFSERIEALRNEFDSFIAHDLNTPRAIAAVYSFIGNYSPRDMYPEALDQMISFCEHLQSIFGVWELNSKTVLEIPTAIIELAESRLNAKRNRNWEEADRIRGLISEQGYQIKDTKEGYEITGG